MNLNKSALEATVGEASIGLLLLRTKELSEKQLAALLIAEQLIGLLVDGTIQTSPGLKAQFEKSHAQILDALGRTS